MPVYLCEHCGQPLSTRTAKYQHEANCSENPANEGKQD